MAAQVPWVATDVGNAEGLSGGICVSAAKDSRYYSVFDERVKKLMAGGVKKAWNSSYDGRNQIEKELTWKKVLPQYKTLVERKCQN